MFRTYLVTYNVDTSKLAFVYNTPQKIVFPKLLTVEYYIIINKSSVNKYNVKNILRSINYVYIRSTHRQPWASYT